MFFGLTLALAVLPFVPAIVEWRRKTDAEPLKVVYSSQVNVRHFALAFREYVQTHLGKALEASKEAGVTERGSLDDGTPYVLVGAEDADVLTAEEAKDRAAHRMVLSGGNLKLPAETMYLPEVYAAGSVHGGERNIYRAVLAEEDIQLGSESMSLRWLHAARAILARAGSVLFGRASADEFIRLESGCRFERLHAPRIEFCFEAEAGEFAGGKTYRESDVLKPRDLPNPVEVKAGRWLVDGNVDIPKGKILEADLVATGSIRIQPGTHVVGGVKSNKNMHLEKGVEVDGSLVSARNIHIDKECRICGPILAEKSISIGEGTVLGTAARPTTVSAENITVEPGAVAHGTVWAHRNGRIVLSPSSGRREDKKGREGV
jgi:cytoskeletal protein CcmA (bactofilin family)